MSGSRNFSSNDSLNLMADLIRLVARIICRKKFTICDSYSLNLIADLIRLVAPIIILLLRVRKKFTE